MRLWIIFILLSITFCIFQVFYYDYVLILECIYISKLKCIYLFVYLEVYSFK